MKYDELLKILRECNDCICEEHCPYYKERDNPLKCMTKIVGDAADAIEELQKPKWIPVAERLPEVGKSVLVISYGRVCFAKLLLTINNGGFPTFVLQDGLNNPPVLETTAHNEFTENRITHWQYLPEPPKEETDGRHDG